MTDDNANTCSCLTLLRSITAQHCGLRTSLLGALMRTCPLNSNLWHWPTRVSATKVTFDLEHCRSDEWTLPTAGITVWCAQGYPRSFDVTVALTSHEICEWSINDSFNNQTVCWRRVTKLYSVRSWGDWCSRLRAAEPSGWQNNCLNEKMQLMLLTCFKLFS
jgi:hypothetical protein